MASKPRVIVVTGASVGIGAAILKDQASKGNIVVGLARRAAESVEQVKNENPSWKVHGIKTDLAKEEDIVAAFTWIKSNFQTIDVLINNAGVAIPTGILEWQMEHWRTMFAVNFFAVGICLREATPILAEDACIVNISSVAGQSILNLPNYMVYAATKHSLKVITEAARIALAKEKPKVRVTIISPGIVETDMTRGITTTAEKVAVLQPEDVAKSVDYVISTDVHCNVTELTVRPTTEVL